MVKSIFELEAGDILSVYNQDFILDQVYRLGSGSSAMVNYRLKDGSEVKWFAARSSGQELLVMGDEVQLQKDQLGESIDLGHQTFKQIGKSQGRAIGTSDMGYPRYVQMEYLDYADESSNSFLFVQKSEDNVSAFTGEAVIASGVMVYPKPKL